MTHDGILCPKGLIIWPVLNSSSNLFTLAIGRAEMLFIDVNTPPPSQLPSHTYAIHPTPSYIFVSNHYNSCKMWLILEGAHMHTIMPIWGCYNSPLIAPIPYLMILINFLLYCFIIYDLFPKDTKTHSLHLPV